MIILTNKELNNIYGGAISTLPNFNGYIKLFKFVYKFIKSLFN